MNTNPAQQFYDRICHAYDLIANGGEHVARERGLELLAAKVGESVLEIGFDSQSPNPSRGASTLWTWTESVHRRGECLCVSV